MVEKATVPRQGSGAGVLQYLPVHPERAGARGNRRQLAANSEAWLDSFSPNVQDILGNLVSRTQIPPISRVHALAPVVETLTSPDVNSSPAAMPHAGGTVNNPASNGGAETANHEDI